MTYKIVNTIYVLVNSKGEIYDMSTNWETMQEQCESNNRMTSVFKDDISFKIKEIEPNTKILLK